MRCRAPLGSGSAFIHSFMHVTVAQPVERSLETRGVAGSTPAGHIMLLGGMAELVRQRVASAQAAGAARRFESCCLRLLHSGVVE